ncbi:MAG TPA: hypothetical protein VK983_04835 [Candidatus Limnocylindrales bacterium]|nr:hypothetical protein [Candidatus Limnocylindrales bacterium]
MNRIWHLFLIILCLSTPALFITVLNILFLETADPSGLLGAMIGGVAFIGTFVSLIYGILLHLNRRNRGLPGNISKEFLYPSIATTIVIIILVVLNI